MKAVFIVHGNRKRALSAADALKSRTLKGWDFEFHYTSKTRGAEVLARERSTHCDLIIAVGGDGTLHHVINGTMHCGEKRPTVALLPCGSGNDYARNFNWSSHTNQFLDRLAAWETIAVDLIKSTDSLGNISYTNNITDAGFGPAVVSLVEQKPAQWSGKMKFSLSILQAFFTYKKQRLRVESENYSWEGKALTLAFAKGKFFGSGVGIAPTALLNDGKIHLTVIGNVSLIEYLMKLPRLRKALPIEHPEVHYSSSTWFYLKGTSKMEQDGEMGPLLPVRLEVLPSAIQLLK